MEYKNEMRPKGLLRGHLKLSKKSNNPFKESKLRKLCIGEVDLFLQNCQKSIIPKTSIFAKWAQSFSLVLSCHHSPHALALATCLYHIFINYFDFDLN